LDLDLKVKFEENQPTFYELMTDFQLRQQCSMCIKIGAIIP